MQYLATKTSFNKYSRFLCGIVVCFEHNNTIIWILMKFVFYLNNKITQYNTWNSQYLFSTFPKTCFCCKIAWDVSNGANETYAETIEIFKNVFLTFIVLCTIWSENYWRGHGIPYTIIMHTQYSWYLYSYLLCAQLNGNVYFSLIYLLNFTCSN